MATIKLKDESAKSFSIDGVSYTKGDYRLQYNAKKEVLIIPKAVANISNLSGLPFKNPTAWTYFVDLNDDPYGSFEEFSLAISDAINFNTGGATPQYKVYEGILNQSGTNDPIDIIADNTLGIPITYSRDTSGVYIGNFNQTFPDINKIFFYFGNTNNLENSNISIEKGTSSFYIYTTTNGVGSDDLLINREFKIIVYN